VGGTENYSLGLCCDRFEVKKDRQGGNKEDEDWARIRDEQPEGRSSSDCLGSSLSQAKDMRGAAGDSPSSRLTLVFSQEVTPLVDPDSGDTEQLQPIITAINPSSDTLQSLSSRTVISRSDTQLQFTPKSSPAFDKLGSAVVIPAIAQSPRTVCQRQAGADGYSPAESFLEFSAQDQVRRAHFTLHGNMARPVPVVERIVERPAPVPMHIYAAIEVLHAKTTSVETQVEEQSQQMSSSLSTTRALATQGETTQLKIDLLEMQLLEQNAVLRETNSINNALDSQIQTARERVAELDAELHRQKCASAQVCERTEKMQSEIEVLHGIIRRDQKFSQSLRAEALRNQAEQIVKLETKHDEEKRMLVEQKLAADRILHSVEVQRLRDRNYFNPPHTQIAIPASARQIASSPSRSLYFRPDPHPTSNSPPLLLLLPPPHPLLTSLQQATSPEAANLRLNQIARATPCWQPGREFPNFL